MRRSNLHLRLVLSALLPLLLAMLAAWLIAAITFARMLEQRVTDQLADAAGILADTGLPYTPAVLQRVADLQRADVALLDPEGALVLRTRGDLAVAVAPRARELLASHPERGATLRLDALGQPVVLVLRPLAERRDARAAAILFVASLRDARTAAWRAAVGMGLALLAAGLLLVTLQYLLVRSITQPISRLAEMARRIAAGSRDVQAAPAPHGELQELATALNELATKLGAYEAELAERSRLAALGELSARIAHEVRNPLTGLKLHLQLLGERATGPDASTVRRLLDEVARLELMVATSLGMTRPHPVQLCQDDPQATLEEVLQLMEPSLRHRQIRLERRYGDPPHVLLDRDRLKQALLNLLVNAADALPDGGTIRASTSSDADRGVVTLGIEDSGPGLAPGPRQASGSDKPFGLGLGLRMCREIVAEHGGNLCLDGSEALGGARAIIELPLRADR